MWQPFETAPKDGTEFLVKYPLQGNVNQLVNWNTIHGYWQSKGESVPGIESQKCEWLPIPSPQDGPTPDQVTIIYLEADLEIAREKLKKIEEIVNKAPELNMSNFDVDEVAELNNAMIEVWEVLQSDEYGEEI